MMLPKWPKKSPSILATFVRKVVAQSGHTGILLPISERGFVAKKVNDKKAKLKKKIKKSKTKAAAAAAASIKHNYDFDKKIFWAKSFCQELNF